ncbi:hypothetical protein [Cryptosporangium phraense]|uniref:Uncharacterized protein n=1 Tax=Cryptosporangium phraense TaxID=2593070 RepID=A0A545AHE5_9ACTN|nr:hypothetical protein [Cryptosporangium phraense]TQS40739.1 hypothetical protein FL583_33410 [Cryptosporangium phraense]
MTGRRDDAPRDDAHHSSAPAYWDELDESGEASVPGTDVLSTSVWEQARPRRRRPPEERPDDEPEADDDGQQPETEQPTSVGRLEAWARARSARLRLIAAVAVGLLLGGAAIHSWDAEQAAAERRDRIVLGARVAQDAASSANWTGARQPWTLRVVISNLGPTEVRIRAARLDDSRYRSGLRTVSQGVKVRTGQETWISMDVSHSCAGPLNAPRKILLSVSIAGRPERDVAVTLADDNTLFVDTARNKCQGPESDFWTNAELAGSPAELRDEIVIPLRIRQESDSGLAIREIRTATPGLSVVAAPLPAGFVEDVTPRITLRWSVADCGLARRLNYAEIAVTATVQLRSSGESIKPTVVLDANAVLAIVRFITRKCG